MKPSLRAVIVGLAVVAVMGIPSAASAAPPTLVSVGQIKRHPTATWTLPPGVQAELIEVATSPETGSDGYFFNENDDDFDILEPTQTHWVSDYQLAPGTYYIHVGGLDEPCFYADMCPVREFSQTATLVISKPLPRTRPATPAELQGMLAQVKPYAPRRWRLHLTLTGMNLKGKPLVSNYGPWASALAAGLGRWRRLVQPEPFAFRRLANNRWRAYWIRFKKSCPPKGMPRRIVHDLQIHCDSY